MPLSKPLKGQSLHHDDEAKIESLHYKAQLMAIACSRTLKGVIDLLAGGSPACYVRKRLARNYIHSHKAQNRTINCVKNF